MTLIKRYSIAKDMPVSEMKHVKKEALISLFSSLAQHSLEKGRTYSIVIEDQEDIFSPFHDPYLPNIGHGKMSLTIEPVRQVRMVYKSPEDLHLTPSKSLRTKLKNCWHYLWDDTEGHYEQEK